MLSSDKNVETIAQLVEVLKHYLGLQKEYLKLDVIDKVVSLLKIWYYDLDPRQIGCHMVIHVHSQEDYFWILYTIAGTGLPLVGIWLYEKIKASITSSASQAQ